MRILVTGAGGFVGRHVLHAARAAGHDPIPCDLAVPPDARPDAGWHAVDVRKAPALDALVKATAPDACIHLAGITSVTQGGTEPDRMLSVNVRGTVNLLHAFRLHAPGARVLAVSTAHVYGTQPEDTPLSEDAPLKPLSMYAISKAAADLATLACADHYGLHAMSARPNNHTGPGQRPSFVVAAFAEQVRAIARGEAEPRLRVGNLESRRDFSDVRDIARAYLLLVEHGRAGRAYNISAHHHETVGSVLQRLCDLAGVAPAIETDPDLVRPTDWSPVLDTSRLEADTGWRPAIAIEETLKAILDEEAPAV